MPSREILMRRSHLLTSITIAFLLTAGACATTGAAGNAGTGGSGQRSSSTRITKAEINATSAATAYDVISQLHPDWLRPPKASMAGALGASQSGSGTGLSAAAVVMVYLDGVRLGGIDQLRSLTAASVMSIEYADSNRVATVVRDSSTPDAAIMVSTKQ
jgi:hypothetical protein